ncbi:MAG TPA: hypothetical protein VLB80_01760 [Candidatus Babeliales bacterium]|nr:hypothetical protein [Candidatus Babeliales bacterium]
MNYKFFLGLFLLYIPNADIMSMEYISDDIMIYNIGCYIDRFTRNALRGSNKAYRALLCSQDVLNENYALACETGDEKKMFQLRSMGALYIHEEIYNLFNDGRERLTLKLYEKYNYHSVKTPLLMQFMFSYGITLKNKDFIKFLLWNTKHNGDVRSHSILLAKQLQCAEIVDMLEQYNQAMIPRCSQMGWH